jgi:hypothetical protein
MNAQRPPLSIREGQFNALTQRADPLGFHIGDSPDPSACKHYQALRMLAQNQPDAAAGFVVQAIDWTQKAQALGANVNMPILLMQQVYQSLTAAWP